MTAPVPTADDFLDPTKWMSPSELAGVLGINTRTVYTKIWKGEDFPESYEICARVTRFFKPEVTAWLMKRRRIPAAVQLAEAQVRTSNTATLGLGT